MNMNIEFVIHSKIVSVMRMNLVINYLMIVFLMMRMIPLKIDFVTVITVMNTLKMVLLMVQMLLVMQVLMMVLLVPLVIVLFLIMEMNSFLMTTMMTMILLRMMMMMLISLTPIVKLKILMIFMKKTVMRLMMTMIKRRWKMILTIVEIIGSFIGYCLFFLDSSINLIYQTKQPHQFLHLYQSYLTFYYTLYDFLFRKHFIKLFE